MVWADAQYVMLLGKRQVHNSTHTKAIFFYDRGVTSLADCQREIQRGTRGQWRYYHHRFTRDHGYSWRTDYFCVQASARVNAWYQADPYDHVFLVDLRTSTLHIHKKPNLNDCLRDLRKQVPDETHQFFCARVSQTLET